MSAKPVKWMIDDRTSVEIKDGDIWLHQDSHAILFEVNGTSVRETIDALYAAATELGYEVPDSIVADMAQAADDVS